MLFTYYLLLSLFKKPNIKDNNHFGYYLKNIRKKKGVTIDQLVKNGVFGKSYLNRIERSPKTICSVHTIKSLCDLYRIDFWTTLAKIIYGKDFGEKIWVLWIKRKVAKMNTKICRVVHKLCSIWKHNEEKRILNMSRNKNELIYPCVYFLIKDDKIVYVGQTHNGLKRIIEHNGKKDFDRYSVLPCNISKLNKLEEKYILRYRPKYNKTLVIKY
jgi:transcriptional regulator with XRE-family HTH domain